MCDLFGEWVPDGWIKAVFEACEKAPQHRYLFLTKNPKRYGEFGYKRAANMWYGTTVTEKDDLWRCEYLPANAYRFVSVEPLNEDICPAFFTVTPTNWVIIGAETGNRKGGIAPKREWMENIVRECRRQETPVFMKDSLKKIWGKPLIQEYPW